MTKETLADKGFQNPFFHKSRNVLYYEEDVKETLKEFLEELKEILEEERTTTWDDDEEHSNNPIHQSDFIAMQKKINKLTLEKFGELSK